MLESSKLTFEYIIAEGPEGLAKVLDGLLEESQRNPDFAVADHYVLYQVGNQKALIKVDTSQVPFHFWYCDLLGRPATRIVKKTIAEFLWEKCGEKERYSKELNEGDNNG